MVGGRWLDLFAPLQVPHCDVNLLLALQEMPACALSKWVSRTLSFSRTDLCQAEREREVVRECQREREGNKWWGRHREGKSDRKRESDRERGKEREILRGRDRVVPIAQHSLDELTTVGGRSCTVPANCLSYGASYSAGLKTPVIISI